MRNYRTISFAAGTGLRILLATTPILLAAAAGCSLEIEDLFAPSAASPERPEVSEDTVLVRFRNLTLTDAVNVEFYATNDGVIMLPDDLFVDEHLIAKNLGVAGTGLIQPRREDIIDFPCTSQLVLGTRGGSFVDNDSGMERGVGTARWAQEGPLSLCGGIVTFIFHNTGDEFQTDLIVGG